MKKKINVFVHGANGKMGQILTSLINKDKLLNLSSLKDADIVVDFSSEEGLLKILSICLKRKLPLISGTTGLSESTYQKIWEASLSIYIIHNENFSEGIKEIKQMLYGISSLLKVSKIMIEECHNISKKDMPSGTSKMLSSILFSRFGVKPEIISNRTNQNIGGMHNIILKLPNQIIEIKHRANSKKIYAIGALNEVKFWYKHGK